MLLALPYGSSIAMASGTEIEHTWKAVSCHSPFATPAPHPEVWKTLEGTPRETKDPHLSQCSERPQEYNPGTLDPSAFLEDVVQGRSVSNRDKSRFRPKSVTIATP